MELFYIYKIAFFIIQKKQFFLKIFININILFIVYLRFLLK